MTRPLIQIDDLVREMTEEEHANYLEAIKDAALPTVESEVEL